MRTHHILAALFAIGGNGCTSERPESVALQYQRYQVAGNQLASVALLSTVDTLTLQRPDARRTAEALRTNDAGRAATIVDSARTIRRAGDTALVAVFTTAPNWESIGGRYDWSTGEMKDRSQDLKLASGLPRVTAVDTVWLLRERSLLHSRWRVWLDLAKQLRLAPSFSRLTGSEYDSSLSFQAAAAREYLQALHAEREWPMRFADTTRAVAVLEEASLLDSIRCGGVGVQDAGLSVPGLPKRAITGWVENLSQRPLERVTVRVIFTSGESEVAFASNIPPGGREALAGFGDWKGSVARYFIGEVKPAG